MASSGDKLNAKQWLKSIWEEVLLFFVPFRSQIFDAIFDVFLDLVILVYFNVISINFYAVNCFICNYIV